MCCEFYAPTRGGVQKVIQEISEHLVSKGHDVTVATSALKERNFSELNKVKIKDFNITGNFVTGLNGEVKKYQDFVLSENFDAILVKAAQQWTFDALWPILDKIKSRKIHIPCGYSGFYEENYRTYFERMPEILKKFDHLIYYAENYRDINFAKQNGIFNYTIIPNGASELEFSDRCKENFREEFEIPKDDLVFLSVGSPPFMKGHLETAIAYLMVELQEKSTLVLNGYYHDTHNPLAHHRSNVYCEAKGAITKLLKKILGKYTPDNVSQFFKTIKKINKQKNKRVIISNLPRENLISTFFESDIFVFASHIEYSPLVLFEASAAGLPFISAAVGNAEEIANWTHGGIVYPVVKDRNGYARSDPKELAIYMAKLANDRKLRESLGINGRKYWKENFTWKKIADKYEQILITNNHASN
jgi:glycosyltransferase involved in cell wall biosynthesis